MIKHKNRSAIAVAAVVLCGLYAGVARADATLTPSQIEKCLELTNTSGLNSTAIVAGLNLPPTQVRAVRARLSQYWSVRGFPGLDGLGLTTEQITIIEQRIATQVAAMKLHPVGWPCPAFTNRAKVIVFVKNELIANGFRPRMTFYNVSPRQIQFRAIQDGIEYFGAVVKSAAREITMKLTVARPNTGGGTYTLKTPFVA